MVFLYNLAVRSYILAIHIAALFHEKAEKWVRGRASLFSQAEEAISQLPPDNALVIWVHCSSLGEFEQGRPVIEGLKTRFPTLRVILTFFSPSGYEIRKNYKWADYVTYLPADTPANARRFVEIISPDLAVFVKYEFWYHHLRELHHSGIPTFLISAIFREDQPFFKWYGTLHRTMLGYLNHIFVQDQQSRELLRSINFNRTTVAGDTRIDRVADISGQSGSHTLVEQFAAGRKVLIAGSTWPPDEEILISFINENLPNDWKVIIAPHQIKEEKVIHISRQISSPSVRFSKARIQDIAQSTVMIIDNVGMLSTLYRYGHIAYIGGGFGAGIHNTLEPISFGLPVIFGPRYEKFAEAIYLCNERGGFSIRNYPEFLKTFRKLLDSDTYKEASGIAAGYIQKNLGSSRKIISHIEKVVTSKTK